MILQKLLLGITLAAPIGPVSVEMIKRGLQGGFWAAFNIRLGGAIGNTLCLLAAFWGLNAIQDQTHILILLGLLGSLLLVYMGGTNLLKGMKPIKLDKSFEKNKSDKSSKTLLKSLTFGFMLAIFNPVAVVFWLTIFANDVPLEDSLSLTDLFNNFFIIGGVLLWGATLSLLLEFGRRAVNPALFKWVTVGSGAVLLYFGFKYGFNNIQSLISFL